MDPNLQFALSMAVSFGVPALLLGRRPGGSGKPDDRRPRPPSPPPPDGEPGRPPLPACLIPSPAPDAVAGKAARPKVLEPA